MSSTKCSTCGQQVLTGSTCQTCVAMTTAAANNAGCAAFIGLSLLFVLVVWGGLAITDHFNPPPANAMEALSRAGYTDVEHAISQMDCREDELRVESFSAFKQDVYVLGVVCVSRRGSNHYRIQDRRWNEDADGLFGPARSPR